MIKSLTLAAFLVAIAVPGTLAQGAGAAGTGQDQSAGGIGPRSNYVTSTGATVPRPGASQSGGTTSLDRGVEREDSKIEGSICKGC